MIRIVQADSGKYFQRFIRFPYDLYRNDPYYTAPLRLMQRDMLTQWKNPFFKHAESALFLALTENNRVAGRIAAIFNSTHRDLYQDNTGFFGLFDCINNQKVANLLFDAAASWLRSRGILTMAGPENISANDSLGILTSGFNMPPAFLMPYNHPYYANLIRQYGLAPILKLHSHYLTKDKLPGQLMKKAEILEKRLARSGIIIRPMNLDKHGADMSLLRDVYNAANDGVWGFMPLDEDSFLHMAEDLKKIVMPGQVLVAENNTGIIGYAVSVPDFYQVFRTIPDGRLFPTGWLKIAMGKKVITQVRIMILGVLPSFRQKGIDWCMYARLAANNFRLGFYSGEACYVMETNTPMKRMLSHLGAEAIKEYTMYSKRI